VTMHGKLVVTPQFAEEIERASRKALETVA
jgi:hypothetical protein